MPDKIAILADIHGNAPALRAVLDDIHRDSGIGHIYCLGDMVSIGPDTNEVLDLLCSVNNVSMISGNHEQYVLALATGGDPGLAGEELEHQRWIASRIDQRFIPLLSALSQTFQVRFSGKTILLQHYHLDSQNNFLPIDKQPSLEKLERLYQDVDADIVCFGHHHIVHLFRSEDRIYVNPGALGCCERPVARYGVLRADKTDVTVELREVPYDNRSFLASYHRFEVPAREFILRVFHGNQGARTM